MQPAAAEAGGREAEQAQDSFNRGVRAYREARFGDAAVLFERAYRLEPHPLFLYNAAMARRHLGHPRQIRHLVRAFHSQNWQFDALELKTGTTFRGLDVASRVAIRAREHVEAERARSVARAVAMRGWKVSRLGAPPRGRLAVDRTRLDAVGWLGVGTIVVGVGALVGGTGTYVELGDTWSAFREAARIGPREDYQRLQREIRRQQRWVKGIVASGLGLAAAGGGMIAWDLLTDPTRSADGTTSGISIRPNGIALQIAWH